jgi:thiol-disulfide isomerase/thioredoxin
MTVRGTAALLAALVLAVAGCSDAGDSADAEDPVSSPLADCTGLTEPVGDPATGDGGEPLPDLTLPCFTGEEPFRLADLRGPVVVNLWASWCTPCRDELPMLQAYADRAAGEVRVLGVVTEDRRSAAASLAEDLGITFPALDDREGLVRTDLARIGLPVTLFVDAAGRVRHVRNQPLDEETLAGLVTEHLGVSA